MDYKAEYNRWLEKASDEDLKQELQKMTEVDIPDKAIYCANDGCVRRNAKYTCIWKEFVWRPVVRWYSVGQNDNIYEYNKEQKEEN